MSQLVAIKIEGRGSISLIKLNKSDVAKFKKKAKEDKSLFDKGKWYKRGKFYIIELGKKLHPESVQLKDLPKKLQSTTRVALNVMSSTEVKNNIKNIR